MKSYVKVFKYPHDGELSNRELFVMRENDAAVDGIELTYLDDEQKTSLLEALKEHEVTDFTKAENGIDGYKPEWGKAWRRYNKVKIVEIEKEAGDGSNNS